MAAVMATISGSLLGLLDQRLGERLRCTTVAAGASAARSAGSNAGDVVQALLVVVLGRRVAPALLGEHVHDDRALELGALRSAARALDVVAVDRPDVAHAERLEERRRLEHSRTRP